MRKLIFCTLLVLTVTASAFAKEPLKALSDYQKEAKLFSIGMCDSGRTLFSRFNGKSYSEMIRLDPVSQNRYFFVRKNDGKEEFFIERLGNKKRVVEQKASAMEWSMELMRESRNYFLYHFFKDDPTKESDCGEGPVESKK